MLVKTCRSLQGLLRARILWLLMSAIIGIWQCPVQSIAQSDEVEAQLRARISDFWNAMQDADYDRASAFIHPDSRKAFSRSTKARVIRWSIKNLEFDADRTSCQAVMIVRRPAPALAAEMDWTLKNQWVLSEGEWYFKIPWGENENPMLQVFKERQKVSSKASEAVRSTTEPALKQSSDEQNISPDAAKALQRLMPDPTNPRVVQNGEKARFLFSYRNTGTEPISVVTADADCHCTSVKKEDSEVQPGKGGTIEIILDTFGLPLGRINKSVSVQFSDLKDPAKLNLQIDSLANFKLSPSTLDFGNLGQGEQAKATVKLDNASSKTVKIVSKSNSDPNLNFSVDPDTIKPGGAATISVQYASKTSGEFLDNLTLETDLPAEPIINVPVQGRVKP